MATLAQAQAAVVAEYPEATFAAPVNHEKFGAAVQLVRWIAGEAAGQILVIGADAFVEVPRPLSTLRATLDAWITDYAARPWDMVVDVHDFDREYRVALVDAVTLVSATDATFDTHAVAYVGGNFFTRKLTNVKPTEF